LTDYRVLVGSLIHRNNLQRHHNRDQMASAARLLRQAPRWSMMWRHLQRMRFRIFGTRLHIGAIGLVLWLLDER
jgi:hypothetical protein